MAEFTRRVGLGRPLTYQEADDNFKFVEEQADAAEQFANSAYGAQIAAVAARNEAVDSKEQAGIYAAAAQAAVGLPILSGNAGKSLAVKADESGVEWADTDKQILINKTLGAGTLESFYVGDEIDITDASDPFQVITLAGNTVATIDLSIGASRSLWINPVTYTIVWPAGTQWKDGGAPGLTSGKWALITFTGSPINAAGFGALIWSEE